MSDYLTCKFCGKQHLNLDNKKFNSKNEEIEYATMSCNCSKGESYRNRMTSILSLNEFINSTSFDEKTRSYLQGCGLRILNHPEETLVYQVRNLKIKFSVKKDKLKVEMTETEKLERTF